MNPAPPAHRPFRGGIPWWGWPLIITRLLAMLAALVLGVIFYYTLAPFIRPNPVPPRFLASTGAIAGLRVQVRGTPCPGRAFFLANHVSWLDILAIAGTTGSAFVAHDGLAGIGPLRWLCDMNGTVFVARHDRRSIAEQVEAVRRSMDDDRALTIFPEGTTSDGTGTLPFKSSLLSALTNYRDVPIQPIRLDYGKDTQEIAWAGEESGLKNAFRILARLRPVRLTVHFLAPLSGDALADRKRMAAAARAAIDITAPR